MRKYKRYLWKIEVIDTASTLKELNEKETKWILKYQSHKCLVGYNCDTGGNSKMFNEETIQKMRLLKIGKKCSIEARMNMSKAQKGRVHSIETRKKMSEAVLGAKNHNYGKHLPLSTRSKIGEALKGRKHTDDTKRKISNARKIVINQYTVDGYFVKTWKGIRDAALYVGGKNGTTISACCRGKQKTAYGFIWMYVKDYSSTCG